MAGISIGLQLFTVREPLSQNCLGTLKKVKSIGYDVVETSFQYTKSKRELDALGLRVAGVHVDFTELKENLDKWIKFSKDLGSENIICPYIGEEQRRDLSQWEKTASLLNEIGARCKKEGLQLSYHNHDFEFKKFGGKYLLDILYEETEPESLFAELDTYWIKSGGEDPVRYIRKYSNRCRILHLKDMAEDGSFAEVGQGILEWPEIFRATKDSKIEWYIVEQDTCKRESLESVRISLEYLKENAI